jgi:HK97 family phage portal protein
MALFGSKNEITTLGLGELRSPIDNPGVPLNSPAVWDWFMGGEPTAAGEQVNEANALQITTVYACVTLIATSVASLPLKLIERADKGHIEAVDNPLYYLLAAEPNPDMSAVTFIETLVGCLALTGNCYAQIERNGLGQPVALWPLHPLKTKAMRAPDGKLVYKTTDGQTNGSYRVIPASDVIHVPLFSLDGITGISPIAMARQALGLAKAAEKFGARLFGNGARPGGLLMNKGPKPDPKTQQEMRESWQQQQGGQNQGKIGFLYGGEWSYESLGLNAEESQFLGTRGYQRADIAAIYKVSPHLVGDTSRLSGTNSEQLMLQFLTITLRPYLCKLEAEFVRKLCPTLGRKAGRFFVQFDVSGLLRTDLKSQMDAYQAGRQGGWYTSNDILRKLGENPGGPECDVYVTAVNYQNSARLLDTESLQDQPIDETVPTQAERSMLGVYARSYISIYSDAFRRLSTRSKRDYDTVSALFRPVLRSIADMATGNNSAFPALGGDTIDGVITDALKAMAKRTAKWPVAIQADEMATIANAEFLRVVRSIHIAVSREAATANAVAQLEAPEDTEDDLNEEA